MSRWPLLIGEGGVSAYPQLGQGRLHIQNNAKLPDSQFREQYKQQHQRHYYCYACRNQCQHCHYLYLELYAAIYIYIYASIYIYMYIYISIYTYKYMLLYTELARKALLLFVIGNSGTSAV